MNFFEVLVTTQSVILGLAATRVLQATEHVFFKKHSYPKIYLIWIRLCLFILMSFWTLMNYSKLGNYNFLDFTFQSIYAGTVYIMCNAIFPNNSENIESWKSHYYKKNRIYWVCNIICVITVILHLEYSMHVVHGTKYYMLYFFVFIPSIVMSLVGYLFQKSIYQWIVLILSLISIIFNCVTVFLGQQVEVPK